MNCREMRSGPAGTPAATNPTVFSVPLIPHPEGVEPARHHKAPSRKGTGRSSSHGEIALNRDAMFEVWRENTCHIVSESYFYKTLTYYTILRHELEGRTVFPASRTVLDASVVPVCLEKARLAGIPVCEWGISQGFTPLPTILYGLNYYATASEYRVVSDSDEAKEAVRHITNKGKYPFCYQPLEEGAAIQTCTSVFGRAPAAGREVEEIARRVYELYSLPLVNLVMVHDTRGYRLSSLSAARYSHMTPEERALLSAYISHQEFL